MLTPILNAIEKHRRSNALFWRTLLKAKDALYEKILSGKSGSAAAIGRYLYMRSGAWYRYRFGVRQRIDRLAQGKAAKKIDLTDTTFIIPIRYDSDDRIFNVEYILKYLRTFFDTNILIGEEGDCIHFKNLQSDPGYQFFQSSEKFFHRTKILNDLTKMAKTKYIVNYDADVLALPLDLHHAIQMLRRDKADIALPYSGYLLNVSKEKARTLTYEEVLRLESLSDFDQKKHPDITLMPNAYIGGAICSNRQKLIEAGMENEGFKAWGSEDYERFIRYSKLEYRILKTWSPLIHLDHHRDINGKADTEYALANVKLFERYKNMQKDELVKEIAGWSWVLRREADGLDR